MDVVKERVVLFDSGRIKLSEPRESSREERLEEVASDFETWLETAKDFLVGYELLANQSRFKRAAFMLHQAVENYTTTALPVLTSYKPKGHDIAERHRQCAALDCRFGEIFPLETPDDRRRFELLRDAYVAARYKKDFQVERTDLDALAAHVQALRNWCARLAKHGSRHIGGLSLSRG